MRLVNIAWNTIHDQIPPSSECPAFHRRRDLVLQRCYLLDQVRRKHIHHEELAKCLVSLLVAEVNRLRTTDNHPYVICRLLKKGRSLNKARCCTVVIAK